MKRFLCSIGMLFASLLLIGVLIISALLGYTIFLGNLPLNQANLVAFLVLALIAIASLKLYSCLGKMRDRTSLEYGDKQTENDGNADGTIDPAELEPYEYEKYVAKTLIERGYKNAEVTQQSVDYGVDILAVNPEGWRIAVQCKRYHGSVGISAVQEVLAGREYYNCDLAVVYSTGSYTQQAIELARKVHVKLYILNRDGLRAVV